MQANQTEPIDDIVYMPMDWLPASILKLLKKEPAWMKKDRRAFFFTQEFDCEAEVYVINDAAQLIKKNVTMSVVSGKGGYSLVFHEESVPIPVSGIKKLSCVLSDTICTLELSFEDDILKTVKSTIR